MREPGRYVEGAISAIRLRPVQRSAIQKMKLIGITISLLCLGACVLADDQVTPTPTPLYLNRPARSGSLRRHEQLEHRRVLQADTESNRHARTQAKADQRSAAAAQAQTREVDRARGQAQRKVDAEARAEAAKATPHATSDLMSRMGFSEQEIAAQKAREEISPENRKAGTSAKGATPLPAGQKGVTADPTPDPGSR